MLAAKAESIAVPAKTDIGWRSRSHQETIGILLIPHISQSKISLIETIYLQQLESKSKAQ